MFGILASAILYVESFRKAFPAFDTPGFLLIIPDSEDGSKRLVYTICFIIMGIGFAWWMKDLGLW